ncbi:hypothetical protein CIHG_10553 [Coccidioides immitis H538.4]|uniref:Uncharacterized protein n=1 Tax=Coccidioides immitis H538.4 TaxID=396776 RepID=A0A0J8S5N3_COCIT|nr:hypothetical protein CIHG_10553 [Coccidioides immitis H538.4]
MEATAISTPASSPSISPGFPLCPTQVATMLCREGIRTMTEIEALPSTSAPSSAKSSTKLSEG